MMREWCFKHQLLRPAGEQCSQCAVEVSQASGRDAVQILIGLVDDQGQQIASLSRRVSELEHLVRGARRSELVS